MNPEATWLALICTLSMLAPPVYGEDSLSNVDLSGAPGVEVSVTAFRVRDVSAEKPFTRFEGRALGIDHFDPLTPDQLTPPFWYGRGVSSGDVNRDGFPDLLFAARPGLRLYLSDAGKGFKKIPLNLAPLSGLDVLLAAIADVNNDGWPDIVAGTYGSGNFLIINERGYFPEANLVELPESPQVATLAASFGDLDQDGDLEIALGNWYWGAPKRYPPASGDNTLLVNSGGHFQPRRIDGIVGETLSILFTDFNLDGHPDLIVGNDFGPPDHYYFGDGSGALQLIKRQDGIVPISTTTTMSIDTGDIDNDLDLDVYVTQIAAGATGKSARMLLQKWSDYCDDVQDATDREACLASVKERRLYRFGARHQPGLIVGCDQVSDPVRRDGCLSIQILRTATKLRNLQLCDRIPAPDIQQKCKYLFVPGKQATPQQNANAIPSAQNQNVLLRSDAGKFVDTAEVAGVDATEWSWNSRFFDADNDGWQDIYVVNGIWFREQGTPPKFFFHNQSGEGFADRTDSFGLQNRMLQSAFTTVDFDRDGDLDIFANSINGPVWFYRNNESSRHAVTIKLNDQQGNYDGIGALITIRYGEDESRAQIRELKAGGGFLSFDHPEAHFGLGDAARISEIRIDWLTGAPSIIKGVLPVDMHYVIQRKAEPRAVASRESDKN